MGHNPLYIIAYVCNFMIYIYLPPSLSLYMYTENFRCGSVHTDRSFLRQFCVIKNTYNVFMMEKHCKTPRSVWTDLYQKRTYMYICYMYVNRFNGIARILT